MSVLLLQTCMVISTMKTNHVSFPCSCKNDLSSHSCRDTDKKITIVMKYIINTARYEWIVCFGFYIPTNKYIYVCRECFVHNYVTLIVDKV